LVAACLTAEQLCFEMKQVVKPGFLVNRRPSLLTPFQQVSSFFIAVHYVR
jgi:hypothetical protein